MGNVKIQQRNQIPARHSKEFFWFLGSEETRKFGNLLIKKFNTQLNTW